MKSKCQYCSEPTEWSGIKSCDVCNELLADGVPKKRLNNHPERRMVRAEIEKCAQMASHLTRISFSELWKEVNRQADLDSIRTASKVFFEFGALAAFTSMSRSIREFKKHKR